VLVTTTTGFASSRTSERRPGGYASSSTRNAPPALSAARQAMTLEKQLSAYDIFERYLKCSRIHKIWKLFKED